MRLEALHHITMITGDAQKNVAFYADLLGLRSPAPLAAQRGRG